jgi:hypothetical protein
MTSARLKANVDSYFEENKPFAGLGRASLNNGVMFITARGMNIFVQLVSTVLLARLLSPHDFGVVAVIVALFAFAPMLIDLGTTDASVQRTHITQHDRHRHHILDQHGNRRCAHCRRGGGQRVDRANLRRARTGGDLDGVFRDVCHGSHIDAALRAHASGDAIPANCHH